MHRGQADCSKMTYICESESGDAGTQPKGDPKVQGTSSEMTYRCESEWMPLESGDTWTLQEDVLARPCDEHWLVHLQLYHPGWVLHHLKDKTSY